VAAIQDLLHSHDAAFNKLGQLIGTDSSFVVSVAARLHLGDKTPLFILNTIVLCQFRGNILGNILDTNPTLNLLYEP
jgi:hypothetical protein